LAVLLLLTLALQINVSAVSAADSTFNTTNVVNSADTVKNNVENNNYTLPNTVTVQNQNISSAQYLYLLTSTVGNINKGNTTPVTLKNVTAPTNPSETMTSGSLTKTEYLSIASKIVTFINTNGRLPNYVSTSLGTMRYENLVYYYSKILSFYKTNNRLPTSVAVTPWLSKSTAASGSTNTNITVPTNVTDIVNSIGYAEAKYGSVQGISDVATFIKVGYGDCWASSQYLYQKLTAAGIQARIMGYVNGGYGIGYRHAWVQINIGNGWVQWNYAKYSSKHCGDCGTGTPCVLIGPGNPNASLFTIGY
jgi:hypothetical protein